ncbi:hypothetical protein PMIN06_012078 [Paraphaeosphaeria minitans]
MSERYARWSGSQTPFSHRVPNQGTLMFAVTSLDANGPTPVHTSQDGRAERCENHPLALQATHRINQATIQSQTNTRSRTTPLPSHRAYPFPATPRKLSLPLPPPFHNPHLYPTPALPNPALHLHNPPPRQNNAPNSRTPVHDSLQHVYDAVPGAGGDGVRA